MSADEGKIAELLKDMRQCPASHGLGPRALREMARVLVRLGWQKPGGWKEGDVDGMSGAAYPWEKDPGYHEPGQG